MKFILVMLFLIPSAFAQVFVSHETKTDFMFNGTTIKEAVHQKGVITIRQTSSKKEVLLVLQLKDFKFKDSYQEEEFNNVCMETQFFPQIRMTGTWSENIDLMRDGSYLVTFNGRFTMRKISVPMDFKMKVTIAGGKMSVAFEKEIDLTQFKVNYAGVGSSIGKIANFIFVGELKRTDQGIFDESTLISSGTSASEIGKKIFH
jgi:hypothetical protein